MHAASTDACGQRRSAHASWLSTNCIQAIHCIWLVLQLLMLHSRSISSWSHFATHRVKHNTKQAKSRRPCWSVCLWQAQYAVLQFSVCSMLWSYDSWLLDCCLDEWLFACSHWLDSFWLLDLWQGIMCLQVDPFHSFILHVYQTGSAGLVRYGLEQSTISNQFGAALP